MRITHLGHACLLVEMADARVLVDPGTFAEDLADVRDLDAVLVTHQHPDHLDPDRVPALVAANPGAVVLCDPGSVEVLAGIGVEARGHDGRPTSVGPVTVTPCGDQHALIHEDIPRITNVGVRLDADGEPSFFHPGDALDAEPGAEATTVDGVRLSVTRDGDRTVVTWLRDGHTCVLSGSGVPRRTMLELAAWKGDGAVAF
ncbi:MAG TPA: MBL fold metallo-hydrolase [Ornithinibacter sp.]|nr:MBL fold metallo-hydrolase [Ornithinibacter sp.]